MELSTIDYFSADLSETCCKNCGAVQRRLTKTSSSTKNNSFPSHQIEVYATGIHIAAKHFWTCNDEFTKAKLTMTGGVFPHY